MATKRSISDYFDDPQSKEDIDRISKSVWVDSRGQIVDRDTFDQHFNEFIDRKLSSKQERLLAGAVFQKMRQDHPKILPRRVFTSAKGKDLERDQRTRAKVTTTSVEEYKRLGASQSDLEGLDTPQEGSPYKYVGHVGTRVVYLRRTYVTIDNKRVVRYRDQKGRFGKYDIKR